MTKRGMVSVYFNVCSTLTVCYKLDFKPRVGECVYYLSLRTDK